MPGRARLAVALLTATAITVAPLTDAWAQRAVGARPDAATEAGGLWGQSDKAEAAAKTKAELNTDPALTGYVRGVACKVAADYCGDIRVYVMDRPFFNASMAPNGYMEVWSGLLLRARSEAELAFVLGHETSHFAQDHSLMAWRAAKVRANTAMAISAVIMVAGAAAGAQAGSPSSARSVMDAANALSDVVYLAALASLFSFSREQESDADRLGLDRAIAAGYAPGAAAAVWRALMDETAASDFEKTRRQATVASIFATHPLSAERIAALDTQARGGRPGGDDGRVRYRAAIRPHLTAWLRDDMRRRDYGETLHLIARLAEDGEDLGVLKFHEGEVYRRRRGDGDQDRALATYIAASANADAPVAVWREIGDLQARSGAPDKARAAYETYLATAPDAQDRWIVEGSLKTLTGTRGS